MRDRALAPLSAGDPACCVSGLFHSGRIVDLILLLLVLEAAGLYAYRLRSRRGPALVQVAPTLLAGAALLLAVRLALAGAWWGWIGVCLACSLLAHLLDLWVRWPS